MGQFSVFSLFPRVTLFADPASIHRNGLTEDMAGVVSERPATVPISWTEPVIGATLPENLSIHVQGVQEFEVWLSLNSAQ